MMKMSLFLILILSPTQFIMGDLLGVNTFKHQPAKIAAMEAQWETETRAPLRLFAIPDQKSEKNHFEIKIPLSRGDRYYNPKNEDISLPENVLTSKSEIISAVSKWLDRLYA